MHRENPGRRLSAALLTLLGLFTAGLAACGAPELPEESTLQTRSEAVTAVTLPIRINVGGGAYTDTYGRLWEADRGSLLGEAVQVTDPIAGTENDPLYQSIRVGSGYPSVVEYAVPVPGPGIYTLQLLLIEPEKNLTSPREMTVELEGDLYLPNYKEMTTPLRSYTVFIDVPVRDSELNLRLISGMASVLSAIEVTASKWKWLGSTPQLTDVEGKGVPALALDASNRPYVAWAETPYSGSVPNVYAARWTGSAYQRLGGALGDTQASSPVLLMDTSGAPLVAFVESPASASSSRVRVRRWSGTAWTEVGGLVSVEGYEPVSVVSALDPQGRPVLAVVQRSRTLPLMRLYVYRFNGTAWVQEGDRLGSTTWEGTLRNPSIAVDRYDRIVVAWDEWYGGRDYTRYVLTHVFRRQLEQWVRVGQQVPDNAASMSEQPSLAISPVDGTVWLAYVKNYYVDVVREQNGAWVATPNSGLTGWTAGLPYDSGPPVLRMDATGTPTVALVESSSRPRRFLRKWNGTAWTPVGSRLSPFDTTYTRRSQTSIYADMALALDSAGMPVVALFEADPSGLRWEALRIRTLAP